MSEFIHIKTDHKEDFLNQCKRLFERYQHRIDSAYTDCEKDFSVQFTAKFAPDKVDGINITTQIAFVPERIKDSLWCNVVDKQRLIQFPERPVKKRKLRPRRSATEGTKRRARDYIHR
jgi:hypothetical protein